MEPYKKFVEDNFRFLLAAFANVIALIASIWWVIDSNFNSTGSIEIEPIVTTMALIVTLLSLNFVNNKLSKPLLKVHMTMVMCQHPLKGWIHGISVTVENHSIIKAFIKNFQVQLLEEKKVMQFMYEGFTGEILPKVILEPGQAFSFNISKENISGVLENPEAYGDFVVTTDVGHQFRVPAKVFRKHFATLQKCKA
ncbi:hypothetical protein [Agarivorans gilvus]|nr:hypothetical protein [Agarivorans gilvus]